jgi:hypothetical protein
MVINKSTDSRPLAEVAVEAEDTVDVLPGDGAKESILRGAGCPERETTEGDMKRGGPVTRMIWL